MDAERYERGEDRFAGMDRVASPSQEGGFKSAGGFEYESIIFSTVPAVWLWNGREKRKAGYKIEWWTRRRGFGTWHL